MIKLPLFEDFTPMGFGVPSNAAFSISGSPRISTGYSMNAIVGPVMELGNSVAKEAYTYENNNNPEHKAKSYIKEVKKHIGEKIDEAYENYSPTNEAMVQIAGKNKPSGAKVLAVEIVKYLNEIRSQHRINEKTLEEGIANVIMENTF